MGFDNRHFTGGAPVEKGNGDYLRAMGELSRVLKPGGSLFFTVPYGRHEQHETFQQFDSRQLERAIGAFGPGTCQARFYMYTAAGWNTSTASECASAEYVQQVAAMSGRTSAPPAPDSDLAAAARAVACLQLTKR